MQALVETAKQFQEYEERYEANAASFSRLEQQFQQIQDSANQLQSLTEERLAALTTLNVELKARHYQGEQTLAEVKTLAEGLELQRAKIEQSLAAVETRHQVGGERSSQLAQTLHVMETLVDQLQARQSQLEQSLVTIEALLQDQGRRYAGREENWVSLRSLVEETADRQAQTEKVLSVMQATQHAEKGLIAHFEKSLNTVRSVGVELEKRQAQFELALASMKATGSDATNINLQSVGAVRGMMQDLGDRQAAMQALIGEVQQAAFRANEQLTRVDEQIAKLEKASAQALEGAQAAEALAARALEKAAAQPTAVTMRPEDEQQASLDFQTFLERCEQDVRAGTEQRGKLQAQLRAALEDLPGHAEPAIQKFVEQSRARLEQIWTGWLQPREQRVI